MPQIFLDTVWLVPLYPFMGAALSLLWSPALTRKTGPRPSGYVNAIATFAALLHSLLALGGIWQQPMQHLSFVWLQVAGLDLTLPLELSDITIGACVLVTGLNFLAQIFAIGYMEMDWGWARFFSLLGLFEAGMCSLVLCDSLFFSYIILEVLTLGTYLLVGLWFNQTLVVTGARDAFLTKRIGDLFLLMGVLAIYPLAGTWNFDELAVWAKTANVDPTLMALVGLALLAGPMGKCAQFPLHLWLDEAMEGPLPSTILRNSVVVATGAWVLVKLEPVFALSPVVMTTAVVIGALSALGGTLVAVAQIDAKRVLSYSVTAFMGLVFMAVGTGHSDLALQLILTHAIAMALLVMSLGAVIWNCITQDIRMLGGLWSRRPISGIGWLVGAAGLVAFPPLGGFWVLGNLADAWWATSPLCAVILALVNGLTSLSLTRGFCLIWGGKRQQMTERAPEVHWPMILPLVVQVGFTLHVPLMLVQWGQITDPSLFTVSAASLMVVTTLAGIAVGAYVYLNPKIVKPLHLGALQPLQDLLAYDFYTQRLYRRTVVLLVGLVSQVSNLVDKYLVDGVVNLLGSTTALSGQTLKYTTSGQSQLYLLAVLLGTILVGLIIFSAF